MEHAVQIERLLAGQLGDDAVERKRQQIREEGEFIRIDRAFDGVHLPCDPLAERRGEDMQQLVAEIDQFGLGEERIDVIRPVEFDERVDDGGDHTCQQRRPRAFRRAETAVEAEDHDRRTTRQPHGAGQRDVHVDEIQLRHEVGAEREEHADADGDDADHPDMPLRRERLLLQRQNAVLRNGQRGRIDTRVIRGEHCQEK